MPKTIHENKDVIGKMVQNIGHFYIEYQYDISTVQTEYKFISNIIRLCLVDTSKVPQL